MLRLGNSWILWVLCSCQWIAGTERPLNQPLVRDADAPDAVAPDGSSSGRYVSVVIEDKPVAFYRFVAVVDGFCADATGSGHHVTITGAYNYPRTPLVAQSTDPGIGLSVEPIGELQGGVFTIDAGLDFTNADFTYEFWVRAAVAEGAFLTSLATNGAAPGFSLNLNEVGTITYLRKDAAVVATASLTLVEPPRHVVLLARAGVPAIFVNGRSAAGNLASNALLPKSPIRIGELAGDYGAVAIYDRALDPARILQHYNAGSGK
jgi:Concanavalin A-like lectin/glucanases superfamily